MKSFTFKITPHHPELELDSGKTITINSEYNEADARAEAIEKYAGEAARVFFGTNAVCDSIEDDRELGIVFANAGVSNGRGELDGDMIEFSAELV